LNEQSPRVGIIMGSRSDWETMQHASEALKALDIVHDVRVMSAHRTPDQVIDYASHAEERGIEVLIAGAGGAAHLAGVIAAKTQLPVLAVPMQTSSLNGLDSLLSMVQMPAGIPVGTLAIGRAGAVNAALLAVEILALKYPDVRERLRAYRQAQTQSVLAQGDPRESEPV
jgi:5-(carboxyamino)imidazole ribonucleotide mutase